MKPIRHFIKRETWIGFAEALMEGWGRRKKEVVKV